MLHGRLLKCPITREYAHILNAATKLKKNTNPANILSLML